MNSRRLFSTLMLAAAIAVTCVAPAYAKQPPKGTLWVTNTTLNNVSVYEASTGMLIATIGVGLKPIGITAPTGLDKVYVSNEDSNTVSVISKSSLSVIATISGFTGTKPHHVGQSPDGNFVYVAMFGSNKVAVIETGTDQLLAEFITGASAARTHAVFATEDGETLLVTNSVVNEVAALDAHTGAIQWSVGVGNNPSEVLAANRKFAYVTIRNENKVQAINLKTLSIEGEVAVGTQPDTIQITPDGNTLVVALRGNPGVVSFVDLNDGLAVTPMTISGATTTGHNAISKNGRFSYVVIEGATPGVALVDNKKHEVIATYAYPGGGRPHGIVYDRKLVR